MLQNQRRRSHGCRCTCCFQRMAHGKTTMGVRIVEIKMIPKNSCQADVTPLSFFSLLEYIDLVRSCNSAFSSRVFRSVAWSFHAGMQLHWPISCLS
jgi:hypothetical protein